MELIRGLVNIHAKHHGCVATIGNFDGVHLGHQALIRRVIAKAHELDLPSLVIIFEPQPNEYFLHGKEPSRLMRLREKLSALRKLDIDRVLCLHFNDMLANLNAEDFINEILIKKLGIKYIEVGHDFRFGHARKGSISLLKKFGQQYHFQAECMDTLQIEGARVSSTRIRDTLEKADLQTAELLLGRAFGMSGKVAHGDKRGRVLGFPTANIHLHRRKVPVGGIFAVKVYGLHPDCVYGVANVGTRPTINATRSLLEVYLFDFNQEIYGQHIYVEFVHKFRDEEKFDTLEALRVQMVKDAANARAYFDLESSM